MSYNDSRLLSENPEFQIRVKYSILKTATAVAGGASSGKAPVDAKREALAFAALQGGPVNGADLSPEGVYQRVLHVLAALETTNTDAAVDVAVSSIWNDMAGVTLADSA